MTCKARHRRRKTVNLDAGQELVISGVIFPPDGITLRFHQQTKVSVTAEDYLYIRPRPGIRQSRA